MRDTEVLIAGAGPTGLMLGLWLTRLGVRVRVVDKAAAPGTTSRALAVQARTLEFHQQLGLADAVVERGLRMEALNLWAGGQKVGHIALGEIGDGVSPFPFVLIFPQDQHERLLIDHLAAAGVQVERPTELAHFRLTAEGVQAELRRPDGSVETCEADYLAGCDGAHSIVRETLLADFEGGSYSQLFYVADVQASGPVMDKQLHIALDAADFLGVFPLKQDGGARLIGTVRAGAEGDQDRLGWEDVSRTVMERMGVSVERVNWFSTYRVHHRVADRFRTGRAFLLGDAAHIHSPVGGQGMNTGLGDAVNLAWKLAAVLQGRGDERLLDTYQPERIAFARRLVATTDQVFKLVTNRGGLASRLRTDVVPQLFPGLTGTDLVRRFLFRTVSQTAIRYRRSPLSGGGAGRVVGGDRLPWTGGDGEDNFGPLASLDWQVHVYGRADLTLRESCAARGLDLCEFDWTQQLWRAGLMKDAYYLVRPDGYVALAQPGNRNGALERFLDAWKVRPRPGRS